MLALYILCKFFMLHVNDIMRLCKFIHIFMQCRICRLVYKLHNYALGTLLSLLITMVIMMIDQGPGPSLSLSHDDSDSVAAFAGCC